MELMKKTLNIILILLNGFLGLTATLGGLAILAGINAPSTPELEASIFGGTTIPGLALLLIVGGSGLAATVLLIRKSRYALLSSVAAGLIIIFFEFVEVLIIGSPAGVARGLQIFYFGLGTLILVLSLGVWFIDIRSGGRLAAIPNLVA